MDLKNELRWLRCAPIISDDVDKISAYTIRWSGYKIGEADSKSKSCSFDELLSGITEM